jgi:hypothetical protein
MRICPQRRPNANTFAVVLIVEHIYTRVPSGSPGRRLTRRCSQLSRSFAWSLCAVVSNTSRRRTPPCMAGRSTHVILILHIDLAPVLTQAHGFLLRHLLVFAVIALISQRGGGREHEGADDDGREEGKTEQRERVLLEGFAVACGDGVGKRRVERFRGEWARHGDSLPRGRAKCRFWCGRRTGFAACLQFLSRRTHWLDVGLGIPMWRTIRRWLSGLARCSFRHGNA